MRERHIISEEGCHPTHRAVNGAAALFPQMAELHRCRSTSHSSAVWAFFSAYLVNEGTFHFSPSGAADTSYPQEKGHTPAPPPSSSSLSTFTSTIQDSPLPASNNMDFRDLPYGSHSREKDHYGATQNWGKHRLQF